MKYTCALIVVKDIKTSRHLYENILKQMVQSDFGENIAFEGGFALHQKDHFRTLINDAPVSSGSNHFELYFEEDELEPVQKKIEELNLEFIHRVREQPWRQKVIRFYDFDKNLIEIGESLEHTAFRLSKEGLGIDEISRITSLSEDKVREYPQIFMINDFSTLPACKKQGNELNS